MTDNNKNTITPSSSEQDDYMASQNSGDNSYMLVRDLMNQDIRTIVPNARLTEAIALMLKHEVSCLIVEDDHTVIGIITNADLRKIVTDHSGDKVSELLVSDIMASPIKSVPPDLSVLLAGRIIDSQKFNRLPVIENNKLVGLITQK